MKVQISDTVKYIGVNDTTLDLFESQYVIPEGVSYNSYVILDEKVAIIDTVDERECKTWKENMMNVLEGRGVDYLIIQHLEPDHAGGIVQLLALFPDMTLVGNQKTFLFLEQFLPSGKDALKQYKKMIVKENDELFLGKHTLQFKMAHMVHWPEVMVTFDSTEHILFSADAFGKFGALKVDDEEEWAPEARRYYFNIVGKYGIAVQSLLSKIKSLQLDMICPAHGSILKAPLDEYISLYDIWSRYEPEKKGVLIAFGSFHGNTRKVAEYMAQYLNEKGIEHVVRDMARDDMSELIEDAFRYEYMILVAASYDAGLFPQMKDFLNRLKSKGFKKRKVVIVENGTWSPSAARVIKNALEMMKEIEIIEPIVTIYSVMKKENQNEIDQLLKSLEKQLS